MKVWLLQEKLVSLGDDNHVPEVHEATQLETSSRSRKDSTFNSPISLSSSSASSFTSSTSASKSPTQFSLASFYILIAKSSSKSLASSSSSSSSNSKGHSTVSSLHSSSMFRIFQKDPAMSTKEKIHFQNRAKQSCRTSSFLSPKSKSFIEDTFSKETGRLNRDKVKKVAKNLLQKRRRNLKKFTRCRIPQARIQRGNLFRVGKRF